MITALQLHQAADYCAGEDDAGERNHLLQCIRLRSTHLNTFHVSLFQALNALLSATMASRNFYMSLQLHRVVALMYERYYNDKPHPLLSIHYFTMATVCGQLCDLQNYHLHDVVVTAADGDGDEQSSGSKRHVINDESVFKTAAMIQLTQLECSSDMSMWKKQLLAKHVKQSSSDSTINSQKQHHNSSSREKHDDNNKSSMTIIFDQPLIECAQSLSSFVTVACACAERAYDLITVTHGSNSHYAVQCRSFHTQMCSYFSSSLK
jgi:hypothetical protein